MVYTICVVSVLGIFAYTGTKRANAYETRFDAQQQRALSELGEYVDNIQLDCKRGLFKHPPMISSLSASSENATGAKNSLSQLALSDITLEKTYKFLTQVGDFTVYLNRKVANNEK